MSMKDRAAEVREREWVALYRKHNREADRWATGYGRIQHSEATQLGVFRMAEALAVRGTVAPDHVFGTLRAADVVANAAMWVVVHETYCRNVYLDGRDLSPEDFKPIPEGHTGGALNVVPGYVGYFAINSITGDTRSWVMGQGHSVAAIDTVNLLLDNLSPAHAERYSLTDEGLTRYVRDFYSYKLNEQGRQDSPLGSHVNAHTAGGMVEGGYLGFTELQYVHMPLPGERLVTFLSDGAFEEERGSDWTPRWWRAEDSGLVTPIMIKNGRRIDQRTTMAQAEDGGVGWFERHLGLNNFDPITFDGRDPAAFAWAIYEMESRLEAGGSAAKGDGGRYPVALPYGIAVAPKGAGFYGEGTNLAHNLPLPSNPHIDVNSAHLFNQHVRLLWVPVQELKKSVADLKDHSGGRRAREKDHPLAQRSVSLDRAPPVSYRKIPDDRTDFDSWTRYSPMRAVDQTFLSIVQANPGLRIRVGNPDEMRSNRLQSTLDHLKFRVTDPEPGLPETIHGAVITALNESAVASAAFGNKGGMNLIHTYEAFGTKMHGVIRQEITFSNQKREAGDPPGWLSVPLLLTSHTWENGKNEFSHQDPSMAEVLLGEFSDVSRVLFVADWNTAAATINAVYQTHGQIWTIVATKNDTAADLFDERDCETLLRDGAMRLDWAGHRSDEQRIVLTALGSYQLDEVLKASRRLLERDVPHSVVYMLEPGRFRSARSEGEAAHVAPADVVTTLYPEQAAARIFVTHTRPEAVLGVVQPLNTGPHTIGLGFLTHGGTLDAGGMAFVNQCTWAHVLRVSARLLDMSEEDVLTREESAALDGRACPQGIVV